jgi:lipoate-protein ligase B
VSSAEAVYLAPPTLRWRWAGRVAWELAVRANLRLAERCRGDGVPRVLAFEPAHAVLTFGRRAQMPALAEEHAHNQMLCQARQIAMTPVDRGGLATLHLPGQVVVFVALPWRDRDVRPLVRGLLGAVQRLARDRGLQATVRDDHDAGVWLGEAKLASIGLRVHDGVVLHGLAVNAAIDPHLAQGLVLCGHHGGHYAVLDRDSRPAIVAAELYAAWSGAC